MIARAKVHKRAARDRELLPMIADEWGIDFKNITLSNEKTAWTVYVSELVPQRHAFVHRGAPVTGETAARGVECAGALFNGFLTPIARKLQLSWPESGAWHKVAPGFASPSTPRKPRLGRDQSPTTSNERKPS